jgi:hypothetical protein
MATQLRDGRTRRRAVLLACTTVLTLARSAAAASMSDHGAVRQLTPAGNATGNVTVGRVSAASVGNWTAHPSWGNQSYVIRGQLSQSVCLGAALGMVSLRRYDRTPLCLVLGDRVAVLDVRVDTMDSAAVLGCECGARGCTLFRYRPSCPR